MGKSRSATIVIAYLLSTRHALDPDSALSLLRSARPLCEPNDGFMEQLRLYHSIGSPPSGVVEHPRYQRWLYHKEIERSLAAGMAPDHVRYEDEVEAGETSAAFQKEIDRSLAGDVPKEDVSKVQQGQDLEVRCRKCRTVLATSQFIIAHTPKAPLSADWQGCAHIFLDPISWMRPALAQGELNGRFECPKCKSNIGKYAWQGMKCSCSAWVVPAMSLLKAKVDERHTFEARGKIDQGGANGMGIRMPPGVRRDGLL